MGRIRQIYVRKVRRKSKMKKQVKNKNGNHKRCSKCGRFM